MASKRGKVAQAAAVVSAERRAGKAAKLALAERRITLLEGAAQQAKEKLQGIASKGGLSPETLKQIEEAAGLL